jgi:amino acid transporter
MQPMGKDLQRDLSLYAVVTISIGAMIGSGIFVLPGLAFKIAGPAVVLAYPLAGLIVLPAALSKAEMATALPESGGTYLYIDRAMGPLMGTIAGIGSWFSLVFKSAFALVGLGSYLLLFLPGVPIKAVALALGVMIVLINIFGVKQTGSVQAIVVTAVLAALTVFLADGFTSIQFGKFQHGLFKTGTEGLLAATGFVFVSYAGVTKVASVAEEVENPSRNLPIGMLLSVGLMMVIYSLIAITVVGVTDASTLKDSLTPMADAAESFLGPILGSWGPLVISVTAVLALASMGNAGVLASSRFPFAMSRDSLAPESLSKISSKFHTPIAAILVTGVFLVLLIAFVDVVELAKLASAFKILVFSLINLAVIAFREGRADWYDPPWTAPGYPWVQIAGVGGGIGLIAFMGKLPLAGAAGIVAGGFLWYQFYGRKRVDREGVGVDAIRQRRDEKALEEAEASLDDDELRILIPVSTDIDRERERDLILLAEDVVGTSGGSIRLIAFEELPDQMGLGPARERTTPEEEEFERQSNELCEALDVDIEVGEVVSHDADRAIVNYIEDEDIDVVVGCMEDLPGPGPGRGFAQHLVQNAPCEVMLLDHGDIPDEVDTVAVTSDHGPFDAEKVRTANAIAEQNGARLRFVHLIRADAPETQVGSAEAYHEELAELCTVETESQVVRGRADDHRIREALEDVDLVVTEAAEYAPKDPGVRESAQRISETLAAPVVLFYPRDRVRKGRIQQFVDRMLYR